LLEAEEELKLSLPGMGTGRGVAFEDEESLESVGVEEEGMEGRGFLLDDGEPLRESRLQEDEKRKMCELLGLLQARTRRETQGGREERSKVENEGEGPWDSQIHARVPLGSTC